MLIRFWAGPVVIFVGMQLMPLWVREKVANGVIMAVAFIGHIFFLVSGRDGGRVDRGYQADFHNLCLVYCCGSFFRDGFLYVLLGSVSVCSVLALSILLFCFRHHTQTICSKT